MRSVPVVTRCLFSFRSAPFFFSDAFRPSDRFPISTLKIGQFRSPDDHPAFCQTVVLSVSFRISGICLHLRTSFIETKKLRRSSPAARRTIPEAILLNRSRTYEINILSILKIRKQSQHPIFSPNPSASDQISPPKKKKDMEKGDRKMLSCLPVFFPCKKSTVILAWRQNLC